MLIQILKEQCHKIFKSYFFFTFFYIKLVLVPSEVLSINFTLYRIFCEVMRRNVKLSGVIYTAESQLGGVSYKDCRVATLCGVTYIAELQKSLYARCGVTYMVESIVKPTKVTQLLKQQSFKTQTIGEHYIMKLHDIHAIS